MATQFGDKLKQLRNEQKLLQRQLASLLDMDTPLLSKIERGERMAKKVMVSKIAEVLREDKAELLTLWLADQVYNVIKGEDVADEALKSVSQKLNINKKKK